MQNFSQGDIWLTLVAFEQSPNWWVKKVRPVIVVGKYIDNSVIIIECTSQQPRSDYDMLLRSWAEYGLNVPTYARVSKIQYIRKAFFIKKIAKCYRMDWARIKSKLNRLF